MFPLTWTFRELLSAYNDGILYGLVWPDLTSWWPDRALCIRRTRTDADIYLFFFLIFFFAYIDLWAQLERDPESDRLGHLPPPPRIMILKKKNVRIRLRPPNT